MSLSHAQMPEVRTSKGSAGEPATITSISPSQPAAIPSGPAAQIPWLNSTPVSISTNGEQLPKFLRQFTEQEGVQIWISDKVRGTVSGRFTNVTPPALLNQMSRAYGLIWFYLGSVLYVYSSEEAVTAIQELTHYSPEMALKILGGKTFLASGASIVPLPHTKMLVISGPPKYVELTQKILRDLDKRERHIQEGQTIIRVFPLNHALAYDIKLSSGEESATTVDGVATTLSRLISQQTPGGNTSFAFSAQGEPTSMVGTTSGPVFVPGAVPPQAENPGAPAGASNRDVVGTGGVNSLEGASIVADVRANAVVVRDVRENMSFYEEAIRQLDVPVSVVEITVAIVDLNTSMSTAFGLGNITVSEIGNTGATVNVSNVQPGSVIAQNLPSNVSLSGGVFGTTVVNATLNMLEQKSLAKVLSRPHVLTLDNFGAVIRQQDTFYVNSTGQYVSNLFNVTTGLSLQVIPHVIQENGKHSVSLQVKIEDGSLGTSVTGSNLPTVNQTTLTTQALIGADQSLLVGGLFTNSNYNQTSGMPILRRLPIVGPLVFSSNYKSKANVERVFLITPRIINLNSKDLGNYTKYFDPSPLAEEAIEDEKESVPVRRAIPVIPFTGREYFPLQKVP